MAILGPGDFVQGRRALAGQVVRIATATAATPATLLVIDTKEMTRVLHAENELSDRFISYMLERNIRIEEDLIDHLFNSSEKRLASCTLRFCSRAMACRKKPLWVLPKVSSRDAGGNGRHHPLEGQFLHE